MRYGPGNNVVFQGTKMFFQNKNIGTLTLLENGKYFLCTDYGAALCGTFTIAKNLITSAVQSSIWKP